MGKLTSTIVALAAAALLLSGCESPQEAAERITKQLPEGCEIFDLGSYPGLRKLVAIRCSDSTVTTNGEWSTGKLRHSYAVVVDDRRALQGGTE